MVTTNDIAVELGKDPFKVLLRPKEGHPISQSQAHQLFDSLNVGKVILIPENLEVIVIKKNGTVKVL